MLSYDKKNHIRIVREILRNPKKDFFNSKKYGINCLSDIYLKMTKAKQFPGSGLLKEFSKSLAVI